MLYNVKKTKMFFVNCVLASFLTLSKMTRDRCNLKNEFAARFEILELNNMLPILFQ